MEEKKINSINFLEKENFILKQNLNSSELKTNSKSELITEVLLWCLGVIIYQTKVILLILLYKNCD